MKTVCNFISRYMAVIVLLVALGSLLFPSVFGVIRMSWVNLLLGAVMFGMGLTLNWSDFKVVFSRPRDVVLGCLAQFVVMPSLAYLLTKAFGLGPELALGVILVGCCPGGTSSNVITFLAKGDLALSVAMTGVSTVVAPFMTPFLVWLLAGSVVDVDIFGMFLGIVEVVILPIALGLLVKRWFSGIAERTVEFLPAFSAVAIALIAAAVVSANADKLLSSGILVIIVVVLHNLLGYALGFGIAWMLGLSFPKRVAVSVEVGVQNSGLACSLASVYFASMGMAAVPGAVFGVWHNVSGAVYARLLCLWRGDK